AANCRSPERTGATVNENQVGFAPTTVLTPDAYPTHGLDVTPVSDIPPIPPGYEVLGKLGEGGMGVVYKARHLALNRIEVVKMIRVGEFASARELARFRFEAEASATLDHPNIVPVFGVGEAGGQPFLAMRWIDGSCLADRPMPDPREAARLVARIALAVHHAH